MKCCFFLEIGLGLWPYYMLPKISKFSYDESYWPAIAHPSTRILVFIMGICGGVLCNRIQDGDLNVLNCKFSLIFRCVTQPAASLVDVFGPFFLLLHISHFQRKYPCLAIFELKSLQSYLKLDNLKLIRILEITRFTGTSQVSFRTQLLGTNTTGEVM